MVIALPVSSSRVFHLPIGEAASCAEAENANVASRPARMKLRMVFPSQGRGGGATRPVRALYRHPRWDGTARRAPVSNGASGPGGGRGRENGGIPRPDERRGG